MVAWMLPVMVGGLNWTIGMVVLVGIGGLILLSSCRWPSTSCFMIKSGARCCGIPINVVAWLLGFRGPGAIPMGRSINTPGILILIYGIAGLCMAATVALITGVGLAWLLLPPLEINGQARVGSHGSAASVSEESGHVCSQYRGRRRTASPQHPLRRTIVVVQTLVSLGGLAGSIQLSLEQPPHRCPRSVR